MKLFKTPFALIEINGDGRLLGCDPERVPPVLEYARVGELSVGVEVSNGKVVGVAKIRPV